VKSWKRRAARWLFAAAVALFTLSETAAHAEPAPEIEPETFDQGFYLDSRGARVPFEPMYERWFGSSRYTLSPVRTVLENIALLGMEASLYWVNWRSSTVDWQYPDLAAKLSSREAFRFDDNLLTTNYVFHPFAGTTHYVVTRANGFGVLGGFAGAVGSSAVYELVLEWKEVVSMNDLVVTPFGGMAMGEFFYQLGNYLNSEPPSGRSHAGVGEALHQSVKATVGLPRDLHNAIDTPRPPPSVPRDNLGLSSAYWHRFRVLAAVESLSNHRGLFGPLVGWDGSFELAALPGFLRVGQFERGFSNGNFTSFNVRLAFAGEAHDSELSFDSHLFGHYQQDFRATAHGKRGYANEAALGVGLDYLTRTANGQSDAYGVVHLLRPTERVWVTLGPLLLNFNLDLAADFAGVHSIAYETYVEPYSPEGSKSSLLRHGYAHSWGFSGGTGAALQADGLELGARARWGRYESIEGAERYEEDVTREPHGSETLLKVAAYLRVEPARSLFSGKVELARDLRFSSLGALDEQRSENRFLTALGLRF
jgi:hypothetical protein